MHVYQRYVLVGYWLRLCSFFICRNYIIMLYAYCIFSAEGHWS